MTDIREIPEIEITPTSEAFNFSEYRSARCRTCRGNGYIKVRIWTATEIWTDTEFEYGYRDTTIICEACQGHGRKH